MAFCPVVKPHIKTRQRKDIDMEFLKEILGDDLYAQIESKINEHNGKDDNKEKQIKLGNLGGGEYVAKGKYDTELEKLNTTLTGKNNELENANKLIAELKKASKNNEDFQTKINGYENTVAKLQKELNDTKLKAAVKVALLSEKANDIDYLTFKVNEKLQEQGKALELDENDNIKGWDDVISGLKTQFPNQFESAGQREIQLQKLPDHNGGKDTMTRAEFLRKTYAERAAFAQENPDAYKTIMKG
jgi:hypothetical protein